MPQSDQVDLAITNVGKALDKLRYEFENYRTKQSNREAKRTMTVAILEMETETEALVGQFSTFFQAVSEEQNPHK